MAPRGPQRRTSRQVSRESSAPDSDEDWANGEDSDFTDDEEDMSPQQTASREFSQKVVARLYCRYCDHVVCCRGMRAVLLADTHVELYSTDLPPVQTVSLVDSDYMTNNCMCKIRDVACLCCGNAVGYHVTRPCGKCLESCNNGHFWMFHADYIYAVDRYVDDASQKPLLWAAIPAASEDAEYLKYAYGIGRDSGNGIRPDPNGGDGDDHGGDSGDR
eukprot:Clim_evm5s166 gene=Clim_evmTU5s166